MGAEVEEEADRALPVQAAACSWLQLVEQASKQTTCDVTPLPSLYNKTMVSKADHLLRCHTALVPGM